MRKLISVLFILALLVTMTVPALSVQESAEAQRMSREIAANNQYQKLLAHLTEEKLASRTRGTNTDYYGGAYINDNGNLTVCVTDTYDMSSRVVETYTGNDNISIVYVDYTYAEIYNEQQRIHETYLQLRQNKTALSPGEAAVISDLRSTYIDEIRNTLVVEISDLTTEKITTFRSVFSNAPFLVFEDVSERTIANLTAALERRSSPEEENAASPAAVRATILHPGGTIYNTASTSTRYALSIGYPVYFTVTGGAMVRGFITTGQHFDVGDYVYNENGVVIGQCVRSIFNANGNGALIRITNSNYSISAVTAYDSKTLNTTYASRPAVGSTAYIEGAGHNNLLGNIKIGVVTNSSTSCYWDEFNLTMTGLVQLQHTHLNGQPGPREGDLGAIVYKADGGIIGTLSWAFSDAGVISETYVYSITSALSQLNCDLWLEEEW